MSLAKKQIYIVDDDESVRRALSLLLKTYEFAVTTFVSAEAFLGLVPKSEPGCLILDIHMPGLDGWKVMDHLAKSGSTRPVIIITAEKSEGLHEKALKAGAVGCLRKPFDDQELINLINKAFEK